MAYTILNAIQIVQCVDRIAIEIQENNFLEKNIILCGIADEGFAFAEMLLTSLEKQQAHFNSVSVCKVTLDKTAKTLPSVTYSLDINAFADKTLILVDDVLNTGKTLFFALAPLLSIRLNRLQVAVIINRNHKLFPVEATYTGLDLNTTLSNHVEAMLSQKDNPMEVVLK